MLDVRNAIPKIRDLASAEFTTPRLRLLKVAARIVETRSAPVEACPWMPTRRAGSIRFDLPRVGVEAPVRGASGRWHLEGDHVTIALDERIGAKASRS